MEPGPGEVHLWQEALDRREEELERLREALSEEELRRAGRYHFERDRVRFVAGRGLLRRLLGRYLGVAPARVEIRTGPHGKPAVEGLRFNLAHSGGLALYAFSRERELGVDLEQIRPVRDAEAIAERLFTAEENAMLRELAEPERLEAFFRLWTRKEACMKAAGTGLFGEASAGRWTLLELTPAAGFIGALAVEGTGWSLVPCRLAED
jgi:4'-phosphopantetheinyl transferase